MYLAVFALSILLLGDFVLMSVGLDSCSLSVDGISSERGCRPGWRMWGNSCYVLESGRHDWVRARDACKELGGTLAAPRSREENDFVAGLVAEAEENRVWINCNDRQREAVWVCNDGEAVTGFRSWSPREPNNWGGQQHCAYISPRGMWDDTECYLRYPAICKTRPAPKLHM